MIDISQYHCAVSFPRSPLNLYIMISLSSSSYTITLSRKINQKFQVQSEVCRGLSSWFSLLSSFEISMQSLVAVSSKRKKSTLYYIEIHKIIFSCLLRDHTYKLEMEHDSVTHSDFQLGTQLTL